MRPRALHGVLGRPVQLRFLPLLVPDARAGSNIGNRYPCCIIPRRALVYDT